MSKFRIKVFLVHLLASMMIACITMYVVFFIWHPAPLAKAIGVTHIFLIMLAIDATLGPLLTLVVTKEGKKSLKFDLTVILVVQLLALIYGIHSIAVNRPVYIAFDTKRFEVVQAGDIPQDSLAHAKIPYQNVGWGKPQFVAVIPPKDGKEQTARIFTELQMGIAPSMQPNLYEPLENQWGNIIEKSESINNLNKYNNKQVINVVLSKYPEASGWLPLKAYEQGMVVLIDKENKKILDIVDLRPWKD